VGADKLSSVLLLKDAMIDVDQSKTQLVGVCTYRKHDTSDQRPAGMDFE
jgi:hypothetical protein